MRAEGTFTVASFVPAQIDPPPVAVEVGIPVGTAVMEKVYAVLPLPRVRRVRLFLEKGEIPGTAAAADAQAARELIVSVIKRL